MGCITSCCRCCKNFSCSDYSIKTKVCWSLMVKLMELALLLVMALTMSNIPGLVLLYMFNGIIALPHLYTAFVMFIFMRRDTSKTRAQLPCASFISMILSFFLFSEAIFVGLTNMWLNSAVGKFIALFFSAVFFVWWVIMNTQFRNYYIENLSPEKQQILAIKNSRRVQSNSRFNWGGRRNNNGSLNRNSSLVEPEERDLEVPESNRNLLPSSAREPLVIEERKEEKKPPVELPKSKAE